MAVISPKQAHLANIQAIEYLIVTHGWDDIMVATDRGTWMWRPR